MSNSFSIHLDVPYFKNLVGGWKQQEEGIGAEIASTRRRLVIKTIVLATLIGSALGAGSYLLYQGINAGFNSHQAMTSLQAPSTWAGTGLGLVGLAMGGYLLYSVIRYRQFTKERSEARQKFQEVQIRGDQILEGVRSEQVQQEEIGEIIRQMDEARFKEFIAHFKQSRQPAGAIPTQRELTIGVEMASRMDALLEAGTQELPECVVKTIAHTLGVRIKEQPTAKENMTQLVQFLKKDPRFAATIAPFITEWDGDTRKEFFSRLTLEERQSVLKELYIIDSSGCTPIVAILTVEETITFMKNYRASEQAALFHQQSSDRRFEILQTLWQSHRDQWKELVTHGVAADHLNRLVKGFNAELKEEFFNALASGRVKILFEMWQNDSHTTQDILSALAHVETASARDIAELFDCIGTSKEKIMKLCVETLQESVYATILLDVLNADLISKAGQQKKVDKGAFSAQRIKVYKAFEKHERFKFYSEIGTIKNGKTEDKIHPAYKKITSILF